MWMIWYVHAFVNILSLSAESCLTYEQHKKLDQKRWAEMEAIKTEAERESKIRRARLDEIAFQKEQEKITPVPGLVATFQQSYSDILGARNHL